MGKAKFRLEEQTVSTGRGDLVEYLIVEASNGIVWAKTWDADCAEDILKIANKNW